MVAQGPRMIVLLELISELGRRVSSGMRPAVISAFEKAIVPGLGLVFRRMLVALGKVFGRGQCHCFGPTLGSFCEQTPENNKDELRTLPIVLVRVRHK